MLDALRRNFNLQLFAEGDPGDQSSSKDEQQEATGEKEQAGLDPEALRKELEAVRKEAAKYRTERKALAEEIEALKKNLGKALGFEDDKGKADVNAALEKIQQLQNEIQNERLQNLHKAAINVGADVELTWAFLKGTGKLVPGMTQKEVEDVLKETLEAYPKLKAEETPKKSGGAFTQPKDKGGKVDMNVAIRKMARR